MFSLAFNSKHQNLAVSVLTDCFYAHVDFGYGISRMNSETLRPVRDSKLSRWLFQL
jgi:hypothetical protein